MFLVDDGGSFSQYTLISTHDGLLLSIVVLVYINNRNEASGKAVVLYDAY